MSANVESMFSVREPTRRGVGILATIVVALWVLAAVVWAPIVHPDREACRAALWRAAYAAQSVDPQVREVSVPWQCRGFTDTELAKIAAGLAVPEPSTNPTPGPSAKPSPTRSTTSGVRRAVPRSSSPTPSASAPSSSTPSVIATCGPGPSYPTTCPPR